MASRQYLSGSPKRKLKSKMQKRANKYRNSLDGFVKKKILLQTFLPSILLYTELCLNTHTHTHTHTICARIQHIYIYVDPITH